MDFYSRAWNRLRNALPEGRELPEDEWNARHRAILWVVFAHAIGVTIFGLYMGVTPALVLLEGGLIGGVGLVAAWPRLTRRMRGATAAFALVTSSAAIVQFSGGYIEAHFHFFVVLAVIALYMDWIPFLLAILYVALDHGVVGTIFPTLVYNHGDAFAHPWKWAFIHAIMVLGESAALLMGWKVAENARRRTALVLDSAGEGIIGLDLDGTITFANPSAAHMTQYTVGDLLGKPVDTVLRLDETEAHAVRRDGALVPVECERTPIHNRETVIGNVITLRDITQRKAAEEQLRRAVSTLSATLESTTDGILVIDQSGRIGGFNKKFVDIWGVPMAIMQSGSDEEAIAYVQNKLADPDGFVKKVRELYADLEATSFDVLAFKDGRIVERYSQPQRVGEDVIGRVWSFRDITERVKAEKALREQDELQAANERLREMDRMRMQFINNAAHELGTPLTPIKMQAHMLRTEKLGPLSDRQRTSVGVLARNVDQLGLLLQDVLDSARVQAGKIEIKPEPLDLQRLAHEAVESFAEPAREQGITLSLEGHGSVHVAGDGARLTQVMFNLLRNAVKFTPAGGRIVVRVANGADGATVRIVDSGSGIEPAEIDKLFQPFIQLHDKMERTKSGTGLGLYISRGIIEGHGGSIWCESDGAGKGATFAFALPSLGSLI